MAEIVTMTRVEQEAARRDRMSEVGMELPCPFCRNPRVKRSDYTRCNPCGTNWLDGEDLSLDPRLSRTKVTASFPQAEDDGVATVGPI